MQSCDPSVVDRGQSGAWLPREGGVQTALGLARVVSLRRARQTALPPATGAEDPSTGEKTAWPMATPRGRRSRFSWGRDRNRHPPSCLLSRKRLSLLRARFVLLSNRQRVQQRVGGLDLAGEAGLVVR